MIEFFFTKTPLAYFVASFWRDEAFSYLMARLPLHTLLWSTAQDANPPLYYLLLKLWMGIFGTSEIAIRSLSLIFFWATLYMAFIIMKDIYKLSLRKSLLYLLLFMVNPLLHYYAFEARMYSMMAFIATLLFYAFMKKKYMLYAYTAIVALFTHYFLVLIIAFHALFFLFTSAKNERGHFFLPLIKSLAWFIPWLIILIFANPPVAKSFWLPTPDWRYILRLPAIMLTGYEQGAWWITMSFLSSVSLIIGGVFIISLIYRVGRQKRIYLLLLLLGWSLGIPLVVFIISFVKPLFLPRYLIFATVGMLLLLIECFENIKNTYIRFAFIAIIFFFSLSCSSIQVLARTKAPLKKTFGLINSEMKTNDVVYVTHEYDFHPAEYYFPSKKVFLYKKTYAEIPWFLGKVLMDKQSFRDTLPSYPQRVFIINDDGSYAIQSAQ